MDVAESLKIYRGLGYARGPLDAQGPRAHAEIPTTPRGNPGALAYLPQGGSQSFEPPGRARSVPGPRQAHGWFDCLRRMGQFADTAIGPFKVEESLSFIRPATKLSLGKTTCDRLGLFWP